MQSVHLYQELNECYGTLVLCDVNLWKLMRLKMYVFVQKLCVQYNWLCIMAIAGQLPYHVHCLTICKGLFYTLQFKIV